MILLHNKEDILSFRKYVSQYLNVQVTRISEGLSGDQVMTIRSTNEKIEEIILNKLLTPFGIIYRGWFKYLTSGIGHNFVRIRLYTEMDCFSMLQFKEDQKQQLLKSIESIDKNFAAKTILIYEERKEIFRKKVASLEEQIEELTYCMENNYWRTYQGQSQICK